MSARRIWTVIVAGSAILVAGAVTVTILRPAGMPDHGPDARAMLCTFERYCRADDCDAALPGPAQIVLNGYRGRSYMTHGRQLGQATVLTRPEATIYAAGLDDDTFAVFTVSADRGFAYRLTRTLIDAPGFETGEGRCYAPAPLPEAA